MNDMRTLPALLVILSLIVVSTALSIWVARSDPAGDYMSANSAATDVGTPSQVAIIVTELKPRILVSSDILDSCRAVIASAREWSRRRADFALVIDKSAYSLRVYAGGVPLRDVPMELGFNPQGPKECEGDGRTPEGSYTVVELRDGAPHTAFHKALVLDYPNAYDRRLGRTGGMIAIHGKGTGKRPNEGGWNLTEGCIALRNEDIDSLLSLRHGSKRIGAGTPVTIVPVGMLPDDRYLMVGEKAGEREDVAG